MTRKSAHSPRSRTINGYVRSDAEPYELWIKKLDGRTRFVLLGIPKRDDESHNCDAMGCGFDHVILRGEATDE